MKFHLVYPSTSSNGQSPVRVVEQATGREVGWINRFLDRENVRRLADQTLRTYAHNLLHRVRWWESVHRTGDVVEGDLAESTLLDYVRFRSGPHPRPSGSTINDPVALADRALRNEFPDAPCQIARGFHQAFCGAGRWAIGRPQMAISRLRVKTPKRNTVPLSVDEVARFWCSFHTSRDLAIVGTMLLQGLRSAEVLALNPDDLLLSEAQVRVRGKGSKLRFLQLAPTIGVSEGSLALGLPGARRVVQKDFPLSTSQNCGMSSCEEKESGEALAGPRAMAGRRNAARSIVSRLSDCCNVRQGRRAAASRKC